MRNADRCFSLALHIMVIIFLGIILFKFEKRIAFLKSQSHLEQPIPSQIAGTNKVVWAAQKYGTTLCGDGKIRFVMLGFRWDGVVVWCIDQNSDTELAEKSRW